MSSSSGSSCSSSDESDSEDSNVSGRSSSEKHSTQGWGLANFMEKKNVPPPLRNLSTTVTQPEKQTVFNNSHMDLADEDSVNWILGKYSSTDIKDYLQSPSPQFLDFDAGNLPMNREIQVLLSHVSSPAQEEQFNPKYGSSDVEQITEIHLKVSGQNEMSLGQRFQWSGNNDKDRLIDNDVPKQQQVNVKLDIEENCDATRLEEGPEIEAPQIVHDEFSTSFYSCPEVSRSFVPRADCGPLGTNCIQPCYTLENSTISCNIKCSTSPKSNEEVRKGHGDKKPAENKETSKKYNSYYQSVLCFSDNEETECKRYKGKNKTSNLEVKPNSEETQCKK
ncbi:uncharacterized protein LOC143254592 [Tachypleus tridentatus]|uniref:uncharacterized protein LOC143254592 n=1 Tax=Tachypleus tridentatus TaxID=6853 RepID=UPI003FD424A4